MTFTTISTAPSMVSQRGNAFDRQIKTTRAKTESTTSISRSAMSEDESR
jgi:hypothetical protein